MKKKYVIITAIIFVIIGIILINILTTKKYNETSSSYNGLVNKSINKLVGENTTSEEFKKITKIPQPEPNMIFGKDSVLESRPSEEDIEKYNLNNYVELHNEYIKKIKEVYYENLEYNIKTIKKNNLGNDIIMVEIKAYNYQNFFDDWMNLCYKVLVQAGYSQQDITEGKKEAEIAYYKIRVLTLETLVNHLDFYKNDKSPKTYEIGLENGTIKYEDMFKLLTYLKGEEYEYDEYKVEEMQNRTDNYLNEVDLSKIKE